MPRFVVLARDTPEDFAGYSPTEMQALIQRYVAWGERMAAQGRLGASHKLEDGTGRVLRRSGATDGPFTEAKEVVGGFWILEARDVDEAASLMEDHPHLEFGSLEIRQVEEVEGA